MIHISSYETGSSIIFPDVPFITIILREARIHLRQSFICKLNNNFIFSGNVYLSAPYRTLSSECQEINCTVKTMPLQSEGRRKKTEITFATCKPDQQESALIRVTQAATMKKEKLEPGTTFNTYLPDDDDDDDDNNNDDHSLGERFFFLVLRQPSRGRRTAQDW